jgi:hypothetical protein
LAAASSAAAGCGEEAWTGRGRRQRAGLERAAGLTECVTAELRALGARARRRRRPGSPFECHRGRESVSFRYFLVQGAVFARWAVLRGASGGTLRALASAHLLTTNTGVPPPRWRGRPMATEGWVCGSCAPHPSCGGVLERMGRVRGLEKKGRAGRRRACFIGVLERGGVVGPGFGCAGIPRRGSSTCSRPAASEST